MSNALFKINEEKINNAIVKWEKKNMNTARYMRLMTFSHNIYSIYNLIKFKL